MQTSDRIRKSAGWVLAWLTVLGTGFLLRFWQLRDQLLADDEWHAVHKLAESDFVGIFTSFGHTDHSIPLTLYYKLLSLTTGLSEWSMHLPLLLAGLVTLLLVPWLLRDMIRPAERLTLACLMAISPLLVYFSRTARPYALSSLLAFLALVAFYRWWTKPGITWGAVYATGTAMAAWLHPMTLALTLTPFVFFGATAVWEAARSGKFHGLLRLCVIGVVTLVLLALLLASPLYHDFSSLQARSGVGSVSLESLWASLSLFVGSANLLVIIASLVLLVTGFRELLSRQPVLAWYFASAFLLSAVIISSTSALLIQHALVMARYMLPSLFLLLVLVSLGVHRLLRPLGSAARIAVISVAMLGYFLTGPLPEQYGRPLNQFMGHMVYQADFDEERNRYAQHFQLDDDDVPAFYAQLSRLPADSVTLVIAPWYMEWHRNSWDLYQRVHGQRVLAGFVSGLCVEDTYGEYQPGETGLKFAHVVHLSELSAGETAPADYLVFQHNMAFKPRASARPDLDLMDCERRIRARFGSPMIDDGQMLVYKLR